MRYAVVYTQDAIKAGFNIDYHRLSADKVKMILNENELRPLGNADEIAKEMGGKLISRQQLNDLINSETWEIK
jgi:hypothetical protein